MKSKFVAAKIKLAYELDQAGLYKESDSVFSELLKFAQITPQFSVTKHDYVGKVPYSDLEEEFDNADRARDSERTNNQSDGPATLNGRNPKGEGRKFDDMTEMSE